MKKKLFIAFVLIFFTVTFFNFGYKYEKTIEKSFKIGPDFRFKLENCNGSIDVETTRGDTIYIKAKKYSNKKDSFDRTKLVFKESEKRLGIYVKRSGRNCKTTYRFHVKIPESVSYSEIETVNGSIDIEGSLKDLNAETVNGRVSFEGKFNDAEFETVNGSVGIYLKKPLAGDLSIETVNGSIKVEMNSDSSFNLKASTVNGSIKSDFNLSRTKQFIGSKMRGTINKGKFDIKMSTVNGSIKLLGS